MARSQSPSITVSRRGSASDHEDPETAIVWVRGDHDLTTKVSLVIAIVRAGQRHRPHVLVDLSGVTFMDASTIGAIVGSRALLALRSQSLSVRAPSPNALRLLEMCGLIDLVQPNAPDAVHPIGVGAALSTWVDVPAADGHDPAARRVDAADPTQARQVSRVGRGTR